MATADAKKLRPAGKGRMVKRRTEENSQIITAAQIGDIDTLVSMSQSKVNVSSARSSDTYGDSILHEACSGGHTELATIILSSGMPVDVRNDYQSTPLHDAAMNNKLNCIRLLCDKGAKLNAKNIYGRTPLHLAASYGHSEAVDTLVAAGAKVDIKDDIRHTPLADAVHKGHGDIVKTIIQQHNADPAKVPQEYQQEMKELLRKEEEKERVPGNKDTNVGSSSHDPQQAQLNRKGRGKQSINRKTVLAYQQAFKKGKKAANKFKIVMLGPEGAGKTSTVHSLLSKAFQHHQPSTVGADINTCTADRFFTTKWKQIEIQHQLENLPMQFKSDLKSFMLKIPENTSESSAKESLVPMESEKVPQEHFQEAKIPQEIAVKVQEVVDTTEIHNDEVQITILDLGGQEIYYHIHFLFLAQEDVVFIAFNVSEDLDQPVVCRQRLTRFQKKVKTRGMQTTLQTIETLMQSVYSHCGKAVDGKVYISNRIPTIVLIATHSINLSVQQKSAIVLKFYESFEGKPFMDHLPRSTKNAIFFVDNSARDPQVFEALKAVALKAAAPSIEKECPISYLQFEFDVLKESQTKAVISKQEAYAIAEKAGLQDTLMEVLHHYTLKGVLLYYPEVETLQNKVFISPQEVSDLVSSVISTHNCDPSSAKLHQVCHRYDQFGLLEEDLLDDMLHAVDRYQDKSTVLGFLENFYLAVEMLRNTKFDEEKESYATPKSGHVFLVPSMLIYNPKVVPQGKGDIILIYYFPDLFVPENIFNEVFVKMVSWCNQHGHHVHSIFHGVGCFHLKGRIQSFKLHHCLQSCSIKCYITIHQQNLTDDCLSTMLQQRQQLRAHLKECIEEAHQSHIPCARPPIGYLHCPLHSTQENYSPHIRLDQLTPFGKVICPKSIDCRVVPREAYALLFVKSLNTTEPSSEAECSKNEMITSGSMISENAAAPSQVATETKSQSDGYAQQKPKMWDLIKIVIPNIKADWKHFAYALEYDIPAVRAIERDCHGSGKCCEKLFEDWLCSEHGAAPKTWGTLLKKVKEVESLFAAADNIKEQLDKKYAESYS